MVVEIDIAARVPPIIEADVMLSPITSGSRSGDFDGRPPLRLKRPLAFTDRVSMTEDAVGDVVGLPLGIGGERALVVWTCIVGGEAFCCAHVGTEPLEPPELQ